MVPTIRYPKFVPLGHFVQILNLYKFMKFDDLKRVLVEGTIRFMKPGAFNSARNEPLNDSMKALSVGLPGREKSRGSLRYF